MSLSNNSPSDTPPCCARCSRTAPAICCDRCHPNELPPTMFLPTDPPPPKSQTSRRSKIPSNGSDDLAELKENLHGAIVRWLEEEVKKLWGEDFVYGPHALMSRKQVDNLVNAAGAKLLNDAPAFRKEIQWIYASNDGYVADLLALVKQVFPDQDPPRPAKRAKTSAGPITALDSALAMSAGLPSPSSTRTCKACGLKGHICKHGEQHTFRGTDLSYGIATNSLCPARRNAITSSASNKENVVAAPKPQSKKLPPPLTPLYNRHLPSVPSPLATYQRSPFAVEAFRAIQASAPALNPYLQTPFRPSNTHNSLTPALSQPSTPVPAIQHTSGTPSLIQTAYNERTPSQSFHYSTPATTAHGSTYYNLTQTFNFNQLAAPSALYSTNAPQTPLQIPNTSQLLSPFSMPNQPLPLLQLSPLSFPPSIPPPTTTPSHAQLQSPSPSKQ